MALLPLMTNGDWLSARLSLSSPAITAIDRPLRLVSTVTSWLALAGLPALSLTVAVMVVWPLASSARSAAGTLVLQEPSANTVAV
ncbi:hypothetical protein D3C79_685340 [compost metagenome]